MFLAPSPFGDQVRSRTTRVILRRTGFRNREIHPLMLTHLIQVETLKIASPGRLRYRPVAESFRVGITSVETEGPRTDPMNGRTGADHRVFFAMVAPEGCIRRLTTRQRV